MRIIGRTIIDKLFITHWKRKIYRNEHLWKKYFFTKDLNLILNPQPHAVVKEGRALKLTCQSNRSGGVYWFYTVGDNGRQIELGTGGGDFKYCVNQTQLATIECRFEEPWTFKLTLLTPVHNQIIICARTLNRVVSNSSTTIFIQGKLLWFWNSNILIQTHSYVILLS